MLDNRFPAEHRLLDSSAFQQVFKENSKIRDRYWILLYRENGTFCARLGMAIAKKHIRRAVQRNAIKRQVREAFRQRKQALAGLDIVVLVSPAMSALEREARARSLDRLMEKVHRERHKSRGIKKNKNVYAVAALGS